MRCIGFVPAGSLDQHPHSSKSSEQRTARDASLQSYLEPGATQSLPQPQTQRDHFQRKTMVLEPYGYLGVKRKDPMLTS